MDPSLSPIPSSPNDSPSNKEVVLSNLLPSPPISIYPIPLSRPQIIKERAARRTERRRNKRILRLRARFTSSELEAYNQRRLNHKEMKQAEALLLKESCMKRELKRAKGTIVSPNNFQTIDIHKNDGDNDNCDENSSSASEQLITYDGNVGAETKAIKTATFAGLVTIQDRLGAMRQALSEHTKESSLRIEPGRHSFYVDAAVSREDGITGIAVVHKTDRQDWASKWTAKGYRIHEALDQTEAEAWAIWQALQLILEKVNADRVKVRLQDPCSVVVVYSDCGMALNWIKDSSPEGGKVVQKIIVHSIELQRLGVDIYLHWVQGHRKVPGNELADLVAKKARKPLK